MDEFFHLQTSDQNSSFTKYFSFLPKSSKLISKRKWNAPNRKWNFFPHFQDSDKKTFTICFSLFTKELKIRFQKMEFILPLPGLISKIFFCILYQVMGISLTGLCIKHQLACVSNYMYQVQYNITSHQSKIMLL